MSNNEPLEEKLERIITPFQAFIRDQTTGSVLLIIATGLALVIANSGFSDHYEALIDTHLGLILGKWSLTMSLRDWVNDGLMALFFFVLGLEIKREILVGELKELQQSIPVIAAALGGMLAPATIFYLFNVGLPSAHGWGISMATDTAFAVGVLALLGRHIPGALVAFLTALAIIDDLGAILVIAVFYTEVINLFWLSLSGLFLVLLALSNICGFRHPAIYLLGGGIVWLAMLGSGVHATVAGVLVALTVPARPKRGPGWFVHKTRKLVDEFEDIEKTSTLPILGEKKQHEVVENVQQAAAKAMTPLRRWERVLEHPVALLVMPVFALTNAGIPITFNSFAGIWGGPLSLGILFGLVAGKTIGISLFTWIALRLKLGRLPKDVNMQHILGVGFLGGIGFTMSIFIAELGFDKDPALLITVKTAILVASLIAGLMGYLWLRTRAA